MQDNLIIMGINAPKEHQAVITRLIHGLADLYLKDKIKLFPYPETMIDEGQTSPAPDILLYDHNDERPKIIIEITHTAGAKKDCQKVQNLMKDYEVTEGFVFDYKKKFWYQIFGDHGPEEGRSYSSILGVDLSGFLK
jgi:Uma2 family endonuclease